MCCLFLRSFLYFPISFAFWDSSRANFSSRDGFFFVAVLAFLHFIFKSCLRASRKLLTHYCPLLRSFLVRFNKSIFFFGSPFFEFFSARFYVSQRVLFQRWRCRLTLGGFRLIEPFDHLWTSSWFRHQTSNLCPLVWIKFVKLNQFQVIVFRPTPFRGSFSFL